MEQQNVNGYNSKEWRFPLPIGGGSRSLVRTPIPFDRTTIHSQAPSSTCSSGSRLLHNPVHLPFPLVRLKLRQMVFIYAFVMFLYEIRVWLASVVSCLSRPCPSLSLSSSKSSAQFHLGRIHALQGQLFTALTRRLAIAFGSVSTAFETSWLSSTWVNALQ